MNRLFIIFFFVFIIISGYAQNDTLYLKSNTIVFNGQIFNRLDNTGNKTGRWVEYYVDYLNIDKEIWISSGSCSHTYSIISTCYRPLKANEYNGIQNLVMEKVDSLDGEFYYDLEYDEIHDRILPNHYCIKSIGDYADNLKSGKWNYFYCSGRLKKSIKYENGLPISNFSIFRENGSIMLKFRMICDSVCEVSKFNEKEIFIESLYGNLYEFKGLY